MAATTATEGRIEETAAAREIAGKCVTGVLRIAILIVGGCPPLLCIFTGV